jgi:beta-lactamase superfamily II metal-dependent hydrolase
MEVYIKVLDIKDADSVIVRLAKKDKTLVFLIDAGRSGHTDLIVEAISPILEATGKNAPDFILCTHFDSDHIGGMMGIVKHYEKFKPVIWIHQTSKKIDIESLKRYADVKIEKPIFPSEDDNYIGGNQSQDAEYLNMAIETVQQEIELISFLDHAHIGCYEPLVETFKIDEWPELEILSPNTKLYQELFPEKFEVDDIKDLIDSLRTDLEPDEVSMTDPFLALDSTKKSQITSANMNSAVLLLTVDDKKFLFAADTGVRALEAIPEDQIANLYWLKVPHHGSKNNINSQLIKLMKPKISVISGNRLVSGDVERCLAAVGSEVSTTRDMGDIVLNMDIKPHSKEG